MTQSETYELVLQSIIRSAETGETVSIPKSDSAESALKLEGAEWDGEGSFWGTLELDDGSEAEWVIELV